ncbi:MAG: hypothetical protein GX575_23585 [Candidatus Anammoximicrobium sp.]|nr:hypothetical protein [Candidatus Anammoximicrobium sp.]
MFKTRYLHEIGCFATTLLASVERSSRCWTTARAGPTAGAEHGSTLASSVVAEKRVERANGWQDRQASRDPVHACHAAARFDGGQHRRQRGLGV